MVPNETGDCDREITEFCRHRLSRWRGERSSQERAIICLKRRLVNFKRASGSPKISRPGYTLCCEIPDYESLFKTGIKGRIEQVENRLTELDTTVPRDYVEQKEFLTAARVALKGVLNFAARYARLAREQSP